MESTQNTNKKWISAFVRLSRKSYFPGAVVSGILTVEPLVQSENGEYISFISSQLHGHIGVIPNIASLPKECKKDKHRKNTIAYGNVTKFTNDTTDCIYQTNPMIIDVDISIKSLKAYYFQMTLPKDIPPTLKTNCVKYFHMLSFCFSDSNSNNHYISVPINILTVPMALETYTKDITEVLSYLNNASLTISEDVDMIESQITESDNTQQVPLEFTQLYKIDVNQSVEDDLASRAHFITSYSEFINADPSIIKSSLDEGYSYRSSTQYGMFEITQKGKVVCNIQLSTSPVILGDIIKLVADFSEYEIPCEQMSISLYYEEASPYLKGRLVKSTLVNTISVVTRHIKKYPLSFSIPSNYAPTLHTAEVQIKWRLHFSFFIKTKGFKDSKDGKDGKDAKESAMEEGNYTFDPEDFLSASLSNVDWNYDLIVKSCVNERFNDKIGEECELNGREEVIVL